MSLLSQLFPGHHRGHLFGERRHRSRAQIRSGVLTGGASTWRSWSSTHLPLFSCSWRSVLCSMVPSGALSGGAGDITPRPTAAELSRDALKTLLRPGLRLLVTFAGDPGYYHERILGPEVFPGHFMIATNDGDEYIEESKHWDKAWLLTGATKYPGNLRGEVMAFEVPLSDEEMIRLVKRLREFTVAERGARPGRRAGKDHEKVYTWEGKELPLPPRTFLDGVRRRFNGKRTAAAPVILPEKERAGGEADAEEAPLPGPSEPPVDHVAEDFSAGSGYAWVICEVTAASSVGVAAQIGTIVTLSPGARVVGDRALYVSGAFETLACARMLLTEIPSFVRRARDTLLLLDPLPVPRLGGPEPGVHDGAPLDAADLRSRLGLGGESPEARPKDASPAVGGAAPAGAVGVDGADSVSADFRVLPVDYDDQGVRYKAFRTGVSEARDGSQYKDWPFQTAGVSLSMLKHFERNGGNCLLWLDKWVMSRGLEPSERTTIEMTVHMRTLHFLSTYDQLNMGAIAGAENVMLRVAQIVEAYRSDPKRPNWAAVKHITATDDPMDPIPTSLRTYNARLTKEEVEAENLRLRMRGLRPHNADDAEEGLPRTPFVPGPKPKPKFNKFEKGGLQAPAK